MENRAALVMKEKASAKIKAEVITAYLQIFLPKHFATKCFTCSASIHFKVFFN